MKPRNGCDRFQAKSEQVQNKISSVSPLNVINSVCWIGLFTRADVDKECQTGGITVDGGT